MVKFALVALALSFSAFARNTYDVNVDISVGGRKIASPAVIVKEGEQVTLVQDNQVIQLDLEEVKMQGLTGIKMGFKVNYMDSTGYKSKSTGSVFVIENQRARFTTGEGDDMLEVSVVAKPFGSI
jgi:hypothetical protein